MKKFIFRLFVFGTIITSLLYLFSCLTPFVSPVNVGYLSYFELAFPYLALAFILFLACWFFIQKKIAFLLFFFLLFGYKNILSSVAFHLPFINEKPKQPSSSITVLSWNVRGFDNPSINADSLINKRHQMFELIKNSGADVLCFQEFNELYAKGVFSNINDLVKLGYQHYYLTNDIRRVLPWGINITASAIFSKIPLQDTGRILLGDTSFPEYLGYATVMMGNKPLRIFTTHFKSINLFAQTVDTISTVVFHGDSTFVYTASKMEKLKVFSQEHARQAFIAKKVLQNSQLPYLFAADLNSVPTSHAYHIISSGLQDAFLQKGWGLGATLDSLPPTLRIDYMFADKRIQIINWKKEIVHASDHYPLQIKIAWHE